MSTALHKPPHSAAAPAWLRPDRPYPAVMGVLNLTPDSFSDGGQFNEADRAIAHARQMIAEGADVIDIGAESTRPYDGQQPVGADEEMDRLRPRLEAVLHLGPPGQTRAAGNPRIARW